MFHIQSEIGGTERAFSFSQTLIKCTRTQCYTRWATEQVYYQKSHVYGAGYVMQTSTCISLQILHCG